MLEVSKVLDDRYLCCVGMAVVLHRNAEHLKCVHANIRALDPLLALEDHIHWPGEKTNECVSVGGRKKDLSKL